jgi:hypothetical protein
MRDGGRISFSRDEQHHLPGRALISKPRSQQGFRQIEAFAQEPKAALLLVTRVFRSSIEKTIHESTRNESKPREAFRARLCLFVDRSLVLIQIASLIFVSLSFPTAAGRVL